MTTGFEVELSDLRGWAQQVGRASKYMGAARDYATSNISDGEFGRILELITSDYNAMLSDFHGILNADAHGLEKTQTAFDAIADLYRGMDERSREELAEIGEIGNGSIDDDGSADGFNDVMSPTDKLIGVTGSVGDLPEVSFGWALDKVCELLSWIGGPDPREYVTKWIAGDTQKAGMQVSAWNHVAACVDAVEVNLSSGQRAISNTWTGSAAAAAGRQVGQWTTFLSEQSSAMQQMAEHLRDAVTEAVDMAQVVVDIIKTVVSLASAALSNAAIPAYGQWKLIQSAKEALKMINQARKVILTFWNFLNMVKSFIVACVSSFSKAALPPEPSLPRAN